MGTLTRSGLSACPHRSSSAQQELSAAGCDVVSGEGSGAMVSGPPLFPAGRGLPQASPCHAPTLREPLAGGRSAFPEAEARSRLTCSDPGSGTAPVPYSHVLGMGAASPGTDRHQGPPMRPQCLGEPLVGGWRHHLPGERASSSCPAQPVCCRRGAVPIPARGAGARPSPPPSVGPCFPVSVCAELGRVWPSCSRRCSRFCWRLAVASGPTELRPWGDAMLPAILRPHCLPGRRVLCELAAALARRR